MRKKKTTGIVKLWLRMMTVGIALFAAMLLLNLGLGLVSEPSDGAVAAGVVLLLGLAGAAVVIVLRVAKRFMRLHCLALAALILSLGLSGCYKVIEPGHVGIKVNQSGSDKGVQDFPLQTGRVFYNPFTTSVLNYPTNVQRAVWTQSTKEGKAENEEINYNSRDELVFTGDFTVAFELVRDNVPRFYVRFRNDDIDTFTHGFFRDQVRDSLNESAVKYTADELYGEKKSEFIAGALELVRKHVGEFGVNVLSLGYASSPRPPKQVADAINLKISAIQIATQKVNELKQFEADAKKLVAAADGEAKKQVMLAEGAAKSNEMVARSITPQIIQWREMDLRQEALRKWNGVLPQYSGGGGPLPFIQVGK